VGDRRCSRSLAREPVESLYAIVYEVFKERREILVLSIIHRAQDRNGRVGSAPKPEPSRERIGVERLIAMALLCGADGFERKWVRRVEASTPMNSA
jgi:hypothetical protein